MLVAVCRDGTETDVEETAQLRQRWKGRERAIDLRKETITSLTLPSIKTSDALSMTADRNQTSCQRGQTTEKSANVTDQIPVCFLIKKNPRLAFLQHAHIPPVHAREKNKFNRLPTHQASEIIKIATQETQKEKSNAKIARIRRSNPPTNNASSARLSKASNSGGHDIFVVQSSSGGSCFEQDCAWQHRQACARHDQDDDVQP